MKHCLACNLECCRAIMTLPASNTSQFRLCPFRNVRAITMRTFRIPARTEVLRGRGYLHPYDVHSPLSSSLIETGRTSFNIRFLQKLYIPLKIFSLTFLKQICYYFYRIRFVLLVDFFATCQNNYLVGKSFNEVNKDKPFSWRLFRSTHQL